MCALSMAIDTLGTAHQHVPLAVVAIALLQCFAVHFESTG